MTTLRHSINGAKAPSYAERQGDIMTQTAVAKEVEVPNPILTTSTVRPADATPSFLRDVLALSDFERKMRPRLPNMIYQYVAGAVETSSAMRNGLDAYCRYGFTPHALTDTSARSTTTELLAKHIMLLLRLVRWEALLLSPIAQISHSPTLQKQLIFR